LINSCETEEPVQSVAASEKTKGRLDVKPAGGRYAKLVALFDTEEVGSVLRVGAKSNFLRNVIERVVEAFITKAQAQQRRELFTTQAAPNTIVSWRSP
jgi:aspartyl aminopeptidase